MRREGIEPEAWKLPDTYIINEKKSARAQHGRGEFNIALIKILASSLRDGLGTRKQGMFEVRQRKLVGLDHWR